MIDVTLKFQHRGISTPPNSHVSNPIGNKLNYILITIWKIPFLIPRLSFFQKKSCIYKDERTAKSRFQDTVLYTLHLKVWNVTFCVTPISTLKRLQPRCRWQNEKVTETMTRRSMTWPLILHGIQEIKKNLHKLVWGLGGENSSKIKSLTLGWIGNGMPSKVTPGFEHIH